MGSGPRDSRLGRIQARVVDFLPLHHGPDVLGRPLRPDALSATGSRAKLEASHDIGDAPPIIGRGPVRESAGQRRDMRLRACPVALVDIGDVVGADGAVLARGDIPAHDLARQDLVPIQPDVRDVLHLMVAEGDHGPERAVVARPWRGGGVCVHDRARGTRLPVNDPSRLYSASDGDVSGSPGAVLPCVRLGLLHLYARDSNAGDRCRGCCSNGDGGRRCAANGFGYRCDYRCFGH